MPLLFALAAWSSGRASDHLGGVLGGVLSHVAALVVERDEPTEIELEEATEPESIPAAVDAKKPPRPKAARAKRKVETPSLFVSAETVLRIASTRVRLRGAPVPKTAERPAGLRLVGVAALGVGLAEGDILTRALGQPALSREAVVRAVLQARARRARVLEGEFYRGSERWILRVEQPYLPEPSASERELDPGERERARLASR
jgi:hypothetical protein